KVTPHLKTWLEADRPDKFYMGCGAITALGTKAREYIPVLIEKLDSPDFATRMSCLFALESMGKEAQPAFDKLLKLLDVPDQEFNIQVRVCYIFRNLGEGARPAIPRLMRLAEDGVLSSRSMAYLTLGALGPSPDHDIVGLLTKRLDAFHLLDRERALIGLGYLGKAAEPALEKIEGLMGNPQKSAQAQAAFAYWKITGETERPLKVLAECLESYDFRMNAVDRAGDMGAAASSLVPKMTTLLDEPDDEALREAVILAFGKMGPAAKGASSKLRSIAGYDEDILMRETARLALESIEPAKD
ncbi:MAG: HEAT repeat domain-containing protein, partial [Planctomycetota bacterium]